MQEMSCLGSNKVSIASQCCRWAATLNRPFSTHNWRQVGQRPPQCKPQCQCINLMLCVCCQASAHTYIMICLPRRRRQHCHCHHQHHGLHHHHKSPSSMYPEQNPDIGMHQTSASVHKPSMVLLPKQTHDIFMNQASVHKTAMLCFHIKILIYIHIPSLGVSASI